MKNLKAREDLKINSKSNDEIRTSKSYEELKILKSDDEFKISKPIGKIRISKQNEDPKLSDELYLKRKRIIDEFSNSPPSKHRKFDYIGSKRSSWSGLIDNHLHRIPKTTGIVNNNKPSYAQKDFAFGNKHQHLRNFSETTKFDKHFNSNLPTNFSYKNQRKSNQIIPEIRKNYNENFSNHYKSFSAENHKNSTQNISVFKNSSSKACELKSMREFYPWLSENLSRAVFKTKNSIEILLSEFCLFSTYKCMRLTCSFFTTDFNDFKKHLTEHKNNNKHYCSFCLKGFKRDFELCNHIDVFHRFDRFQCSHCMYRSCQKSYVFLHQKKFHSGQNCEVLVSPIQKLLRSTLLDEKNGMRRNREIFVRAYCCKVPNCKEIFYNKGNFKKHLELKIAQPKFAEFGDIICQQLVEIDHRRNFKNVEGVTQCLFCNFGTDDDNIIEHMSLYHQSQFPFVCIRKMNPNYLDRILFNKETLETHTTIEFIGNHPGKLKDFNGDLKNLRSE
ncbi:hypothetical protein PVAND_006358 [Polypedilum vanderplanki]|nr:hypothetical protein PVAND_006358 [Polypedilum vanderplanki]